MLNDCDNTDASILQEDILQSALVNDRLKRLSITMLSSQAKKAGLFSPTKPVTHALSRIFRDSKTLECLSFEILPQSLSREPKRVRFNISQCRNTALLCCTILVEGKTGRISCETNQFSMDVIEDPALTIPRHISHVFRDFDVL